jgi:hypothetical protein
MFIEIAADRLACSQPTETGLSDRDEVYFALFGASQQAPIHVPRVSPPPPEDYYGLHAGQAASNIRLWQGFLGNGETAFLTVVVREQDNAQAQVFATLLHGAATTLGAILTGGAVGPSILNALKEAAEDLVKSFTDDGDQTIGAFAVRVTNQNQTLAVEWSPLADASIITTAPHTGPSKTLTLSGATAHYTVSARAARSQLPMVVNQHSGKCLDVVAADLADHANVQQFTPHGGENQRWLLKHLGFSSASPVSPLPFPYYALLAEHSGKALDVAGGDTADGANVQQYAAHYGANQSWILVPTSGEQFVLLNLHSRKVLDVADASTDDGANIQQFSYHGGDNQRWQLRF